MTLTLDPGIVSTAPAKNGAAKNKRSQRGPAVKLPAVLSVIGHHEPTRRLVLDVFKKNGGDLNAWHERRTRDVMADALTRAEDVLEFTKGSFAAESRAAVRLVRRRLELEAT